MDCGWKMRQRKCCQLQCGEGEGHVVIELPCVVWGVKRRAASMPLKGGLEMSLWNLE